MMTGSGYATLTGLMLFVAILVLLYGEPPGITICPRGYRWWDGSPYEIDYGYWGVVTYTFAVESWSDTAISVRALADGETIPVHYLFHPVWQLAIERADGTWNTGSAYWP